MGLAFLRFALLGLVAASVAAGCAVPTEEAAGEGADAVSVSKGALAKNAAAAKKLADRVAARDPGVTLLPAQADALSSQEYGSWHIAMFRSDAAETGFVFLPSRGAAPGSFGLVLADPEDGVVALAAYVPDEAKDAEAIARRILEALPEDGSKVAPGTKTAGVLGNLVREGIGALAGKFLSARSAETLTTKLAEARIASKLSQSTWKELAQAIDAKALEALRKSVVELRAGLGSRKVLLVEAPTSPKAAAVTEDVPGMVLYTSLLTRFEKKTSGMALAIPRLDGGSAPAVLWALESGMPVVIEGGSRSPRAVLEALRDAAMPGWKASFDTYLADPAKVGLVRVVDGQGAAPLETFARFWAIADQAVSFELAAGATKAAGPFAAWLSRFASFGSFDLVTGRVTAGTF